MFRPESRRALVMAAVLAEACATPSQVVARQEAPPPRTIARAPVPGAVRAALDPQPPHERLPAGMLFRLDTGSTVHAPAAVGPDGLAYVGTGDGRVLAVDQRGALAWSYTVDGSVAFAPLPSGEHVVVTTAARRLYGFSPGGSLGWASRLPFAPAADPVRSPAWGLVLAGQDGSLWAYSERGTPAWHASDAPRDVSAPPAVSGQSTAIGTRSGEVHVFLGARRKRVVRVNGSVQAVWLASDGALTVLAGGALTHLDGGGAVAWTRADVAWATVTADGAVVVSPAGELARLDGTGTGRLVVQLDAQASAPPVPGDGGAVYVAASSGELCVVGAAGGVRRVPVGRGALWAPVVDPARRRVVVTSGSGIVAAVAAEG